MIDQATTARLRDQLRGSVEGGRAALADQPSRTFPSPLKRLRNSARCSRAA